MKTFCSGYHLKRKQGLWNKVLHQKDDSLSVNQSLNLVELSKKVKKKMLWVLDNRARILVSRKQLFSPGYSCCNDLLGLRYHANMQGHS